MASKGYPANVRRGSTLWKIGLWATFWWAVSCLYVLLLVWQARDAVEPLGWTSAIGQTYGNSAALPALLGFILIVWAIGGIIWLRELKKQKISYNAAFKDLFLTIRK